MKKTIFSILLACSIVQGGFGQGFTPQPWYDSQGRCWTLVADDGSWSYGSLQTVHCWAESVWNTYYSAMDDSDTEYLHDLARCERDRREEEREARETRDQLLGAGA